ncbi:MAG: hypothetical protein WC551_12275 [Patescibacteria group bacterium]
MADTTQLEDIQAELRSLKSELQKIRKSLVDYDNVKAGRENWCDIAPGSFNLDRLDFWYKITSRVERTVDINGGYFKHALARYSVAALDDLIINTSPTYIYITYVRDVTPTIQDTTDLADTLGDANTYKRLLFTFLVVDGRLTKPYIHSIGAIDIGTYWA